MVTSASALSATSPPCSSCGPAATVAVDCSADLDRQSLRGTLDRLNPALPSAWISSASGSGTREGVVGFRVLPHHGGVQRILTWTARRRYAREYRRLSAHHAATPGTFTRNPLPTFRNSLYSCQSSAAESTLEGSQLILE
jgi:hypothetical protein